MIDNSAVSDNAGGIRLGKTSGVRAGEGREIKNELDAFVNKYGTGVERRGERGKKKYDFHNPNVSSRLCSLLIKHTDELLLYALNRAKVRHNTYFRRIAEEVFYDKLFEIIADFDPNRNMLFSNYFIFRIAMAILDENRTIIKTGIASPDKDSNDEENRGPEVMDECYKENDHTEIEAKEAALQFCSLLCLMLKNVSSGKSKMYRMFYTEQYIILCQDLGGIFFSECRHEKQLWDNLDEVLMECIFKEMPIDPEGILSSQHKTMQLLMSNYDGNDQILPAAKAVFKTIFKGMRDLKKEIEVPLENRVFVASDFIRKHDIELVPVPSAITEAHVSQSRNGKWAKGILKSPGFNQLKEEIAKRAGIQP